MFVPSPTRLFLIAEKSVLLLPGPTMVFRPRFPKVPLAARANADVLNHRSGERSPEGKFGLPIRFGRSLPEAPVLLLSARMLTVKGRPLWNDEIPEICQPLASQLPIPCALGKKCFADP